MKSSSIKRVTIDVARTKAGMSTVELARRSGVPRGTLYNWRKGRVLPAEERKINPVSKALRCKVRPVDDPVTIRDARLDAGMTLIELADTIGVNWKTLYNWERGYWPSNSAHVTAIAKATRTRRAALVRS